MGAGGQLKKLCFSVIMLRSSAEQSLVSSPQVATGPAEPIPWQIMFLTSSLGGTDRTIPENAGRAHTGGPMHGALEVAALVLMQAMQASLAPVNGAPALKDATSVDADVSKEQANEGGVGVGQLKNVRFSLMTCISDSLQRLVRRPVQIMSIISWLGIVTPAN